MEHGWGIIGREQSLENGDLKVPVPEALEKAAGWPV